MSRESRLHGGEHLIVVIRDFLTDVVGHEHVQTLNNQKENLCHQFFDVIFGRQRHKDLEYVALFQ